jgi:hypothetical protein
LATLIRPSGEIKEVFPKHGEFTLEELYQIIECDMIEIVYAGDKLCVIDEDGKAKELPRNDEATRRVRPYLYEWDYIVGNMLVCSSNEIS